MKRSEFLSMLLIPFSLSLSNILFVPECYPTVQEAIFSSTDGDTVMVISDILYLPEHLNISGKNLYIFNHSLTGKFTKTQTIPPMEIPKRLRTRPSGWQGVNLVNRLDAVSDNSGDIAFSQQNTPWVVWWGKPLPGEELQIYYTLWNGANWNDEKMVNPEDTFPDYQPRITFDYQNRAWVAWTHEDGPQGHGDWEIYYTSWNENDWSLPLLLNQTNLLRSDYAERIANNGNEMWVVADGFYYNGNIFPDSCAVFASRWDGAHWELLTQVSPSDGGVHWFGDIAVDDNGRPHIVWCESYSGKIYYCKQDNTGWTTPIWINDTSLVRCASWAAPQIAIDDNGDIHVVWVGVASGESDQDIFYCKYDGQRWSEPLHLNDNDDYDEYYPRIALNDPGNIWTAWDKEIAFWVSPINVSHYNGIDWSNEESIVAEQTDYNNYNSLALETNGSPWVIWNGRTISTGSFDIYSNRYLSVGIGDNLPLDITTSSLEIFPNPFRNNTSITFQTNTFVNIAIAIFDINGRIIKKLKNGPTKTNELKVKWDGTDESNTKVNKGIYFCKISSNGFTLIKKLIFTN